jgi:Rhodopirellula transposase DDE domain
MTCLATRAEGTGGRTHDRAEFAVESIRRWWRQCGVRHSPGARRLFIGADSGGSNAARNRAWQYHRPQFSDEAAWEIVVGHDPPGTSQWNRIEHQMFSFLSMNGKGEPWVSFQTVVKLISATKTTPGLRVTAVLDKGHDETGVKISKEQRKALHLRPHRQNPEWNYSLRPRMDPSMPPK